MKKKTQRQRPERKTATKRKQLPFLIPQTHTQEHRRTRVGRMALERQTAYWLEIFISTKGRVPDTGSKPRNSQYQPSILPTAL